MTPPTDSLEAALAKVPLRCVACGFVAPLRPFSHIHTGFAQLPNDLAAAAREWAKQQMPLAFLIAPFESKEQQSQGAGYNTALADVARALGL
jgi:hypothetical protein